MRAVEVLRLVSGSLQDLEPGIESRWPWTGGDSGQVGLLDFLNAALRAVSMQRPDVTAVTEAIQLEAGMRQRLPRRRIHRASRDATLFVELARNMGPNGETPGPPITAVPPSILLAWADPGRSGRIVENFAYDRLINKDVYHVYPAVPRDGEVWVEATYCAPPEIIRCPEQDIGVPDDYAAALTHHMLASILSGDNENSNAGKAAYHMQMYSSILGMKTNIDGTWPKSGGFA